MTHHPLARKSKCVVTLEGNDGFTATMRVSAETFGEAEEKALQKFEPLTIEALKVVAISLE